MGRCGKEETKKESTPLVVVH